FLDNFIVSEMARRPERVKIFCAKDPLRSSDLIRSQLEQEIKKGKLAAISAEQFMVNLISLCNYPLLAKSVIQTVHGLSDSAYRRFLVERKKIIYQTIFNEEMPELLTSNDNTKKSSLT